MFDNMQQPADAARAGGYGEVGALPGAMFESFRRMFAAADAPVQRQVVEALGLGALDAPAGASARGA
jgi:hypothetical protein